MEVSKAIYNHYGQALVIPGTNIRDYGIQSLKKKGIKGLYIYIDGPDEDDFPFTIKNRTADVPTYEELNNVSELAQQNISDHTEKDPALVTFTTEVRDRIAVGIEYLYNNVETPEMDEAASAITTDIMDAIFTQKAIALDLNVLKARDEYTFKHSVDVATISMIVAKHLEYSHDEIYDIGISSLLHDVGKSNIPLEILNKAGKLDDYEFQIMKKHPLYSYRMLKERGTYKDVVCQSVLQHHEKINGKGYPYGLTADKITPYAKIISVADIYDALVTDRPYKNAFKQGDAVEMVMSLTEDIDSTILSAFLSSIILYPVGSKVRLSNGEIAQVVKNYDNTPLRPKVVGIKSGKVYNLHEDLNCASIVIISILGQ